MQHYDELGVAPTATAAEIRSSYLALARRFHPDRLGDAPPADRARAAARMARINAAWAVLGDIDRRAAYDAAWREGEATSGATVRDPGSSFRAYDDADDDFDPSMFDDTPSGAPTLHRSLTFLPAGLGAAGAVMVVLGMVLRLGGLAGFGLLLLVGSGLTFLFLPLVALFNSARADRDP